MSEKVPARFRKTKTEKWAVMAPVEDLEKALAEGGKIEVQRKSGDWTSFTVGSLGRPFEVDGIQMCYGYAPGDEDPGAGGPPPAGDHSDTPAPAGAPRAGGSGGGGGSRRGGGGGQRPVRASSGGRPARPAPEPPPRDHSEPLPDYRGGPDDEWSEF